MGEGRFVPEEFQTQPEAAADAPRDVAAIMASERVELTAARASGPGGQNVNKVESKAVVRYDVRGSSAWTDEEKGAILAQAGSKATEAGEIVFGVQDERSQLQNKALAMERLTAIIEQALKPKKERKATKPTRGSVERRLGDKQRQSRKKSDRRGGDWE